MLSLMEVYSMTEYPIIPSRELVQEWLNTPRHTHAPKDGTFVVQKCHSLSNSEVMALAEQAARWGADQELEACCWWLRTNRGACFSSSVERELLTARSPKPPTLAEQALALLGSLHNDLKMHGLGTDTGVIRAALERLQELEQSND